MQLVVEELENLGKEIRNVLRLYKEGLVDRSLSRQVENVLDVALNTGQLRSIISRLPNMFKITKLPSGQWHFLHVTDQKTAHLERFASYNQDGYTSKILNLPQNRLVVENIFPEMYTGVQEGLTDLLLDQLQEIVENEQSGLKIDQIKTEYHSRFNYPLLAEDYGFSSLHDLLYAVVYDNHSRDLELTFDPHNCWRLSVGKLAKEDENYSHFGLEQCSSLIICREEVDKISKILIKHPSGVYPRELHGMYQAYYGVPLDPERYFCQTLEELIALNSFGWKIDSGRIKIQDSSKISECHNGSHPRASIMLKEKMKNVKEKNNSCDTALMGNVTGLKEIPCILDRLNLKIGTYVRIIVSNIVDPDRMFGRLQQHNEVLSKIQEELNMFYYNCINSTKFSVKRVEEGLKVAAVNVDGNWCRGVVKHLLDDYYCIIFYLDYGLTCKVKITTLRHLEDRFSKTMALAFRFGLSGMEAVYKKWDKTWTPEFRREVRDLISKSEIIYNQPVTRGKEELKGGICLIKTASLHQINKGTTLSVWLMYVREGNILLEVNRQLLKRFHLLSLEEYLPWTHPSDLELLHITQAKISMLYTVIKTSLACGLKGSVIESLKEQLDEIESEVQRFWKVYRRTPSDDFKQMDSMTRKEMVKTCMLINSKVPMAGRIA